MGKVNPIKSYGFGEVHQENAVKESDYDSDEAAETIAIAKKMLRKKKRIEIIDSSINRYAFSDRD